MRYPDRNLHTGRPIKQKKDGTYSSSAKTATAFVIAGGIFCTLFLPKALAG